MRTSLTRLAVAAGLAATLLSGCAGKPPAAPASGPRRDVTGQLTAARAYLTGLARQRQFSGTVLVAMNGHVLLQGGYGWADAASHVPNRPATRFRIASLTKQFTAMAIMQLQNEGRLKVTDHVCTFITGCPQIGIAHV
jgi:CubicO group peptidase (beta-lactamase class C family)